MSTKHLAISAIVSALTAAAFSLYNASKVAEMGRRNIVKLSYETGCMQSARSACGFVEDDFKRSDCQEKAIRVCPVMAHEFRRWIFKEDQ